MIIIIIMSRLIWIYAVYKSPLLSSVAVKELMILLRTFSAAILRAIHLNINYFQNRSFSYYISFTYHLNYD